MSTDRDVLLRISLLEKKVTELYGALGRAEPTELTGEVSDEVRALVASGQSMEAMKLHKEQTSCDLIDAKVTIEQLAAHMAGG